MKTAIYSSFKARSCLAILLCILMLSPLSHANPGKHSKKLQGYANLWKGLLAEASNQGPAGMEAVACVVRNRYKAGMDHGLVGMKRRDLDTFCQREGHKQRQIAEQIIHKVFILNSLDITNGASFFESIDFIKDLKKWSQNKIILTHIGKHYFYNYKEKQ